MEPGCTHQDFGRDVQPAAPNRPRCRAEALGSGRLDDIFEVLWLSGLAVRKGVCTVFIIVRV